MIVTCPKCGLRLTADDSLAGQQARCAGCSTVFVVAAEAAPAVLSAAPVEPLPPPPLPDVPRPFAPAGPADRVARGCYRGYLICGLVTLALLAACMICSVYNVMRGGNENLFVVAGILALAAVPAYATGLVLYLIVLSRMWRAVQPAAVTPGLAAGLMLVPLFNAYWAFRTHGGWCSRYNQRLAEGRIPSPPKSRLLGDSAAILWIISVAGITLAAGLLSERLAIDFEMTGFAAGMLIILGALGHLAYFILLALFLKSGCDGIDVLSPPSQGRSEA